MSSNRIVKGGKFASVKDKGQYSEKELAQLNKLVEPQKPYVKRTYEESFKSFTDKGIKAPQSSVIIEAPIPEERTAGGIWRLADTTMGSDARKEAFFQWHRVLAVASNITDVNVGDEIWINNHKLASTMMNPMGHIEIPRVDVDGMAYVKIDYFMIDAVRPYQSTNYPSKGEAKDATVSN